MIQGGQRCTRSTGCQLENRSSGATATSVGDAVKLPFCNSRQAGRRGGAVVPAGEGVKNLEGLGVSDRSGARDYRKQEEYDRNCQQPCAS